MPHFHTLTGQHARGIAVGFLSLVTCLGSLLAAENSFPRKPIKVIIPFREGGLNDTVVRTIQDAIDREKLSPKPFSPRNIPGAGGTIGSRRVKNAPPDGYTILNLHDGILTAKYAPYSPVNYGPEAFEPIAATGSSQTVVCVGHAETWTTLRQLLEEAAKKPDEVLFAANRGAPSHFVALMLQERHPGALFRLVNTGGGMERFNRMAGGHLQVSIFSVAEYENLRRSDARPEGLKAVAYLGKERHPRMPAIPTAIEQGYDLIAGTTQFWFAPKNTPKDRIERLADILESAMKSDRAQDRFDQLGIEPVFLRGEELEAHLAETERKISAVEISEDRAPVSLRVVPGLLIGVVIFGLVALFQRPKGDSAAISLSALVIFGAYIVFVLLLGTRVFPFWLLAFVFAAGLGAFLAESPKQRPTAVGIGLALALALHLIFQHVLIIDLP